MEAKVEAKIKGQQMPVDLGVFILQENLSNIFLQDQIVFVDDTIKSGQVDALFARLNKPYYIYVRFIVNKKPYLYDQNQKVLVLEQKSEYSKEKKKAKEAVRKAAYNKIELFANELMEYLQEEMTEGADGTFLKDTIINDGMRITLYNISEKHLPRNFKDFRLVIQEKHEVKSFTVFGVYPNRAGARTELYKVQNSNNYESLMMLFNFRY